MKHSERSAAPEDVLSEKIQPRYANGNKRGKRLFVRQLLPIVLLPVLLILGYSCETTDSTPIYNLTTAVSPEEGGTVQPSGGEFEQGGQIEISAEPSENWRFVRWEGDLNGSSSIGSLTFDGDKNVTAVFALREYELSIDIAGEGRVDEEVIEDPAKTEYEHGTTVQLTAVPDDGWRFVGWEGDLSGDENPQTITVEDEKNVTAVFELNEYELEINIEGEGQVTEEEVEDPARTEYRHGTAVRLTAEPEQGWRFDRWEGDLSGDENPQTIVVEDEKNVTAVFERLEYTFNFLIDGQGQVLTDPDQSVFHYGDEVFLTAEPDEIFRFVEWSGELTGTEAEKTYIIEGDESELTKEIAALFVEILHPLWAMGYNHNGQLGDGTSGEGNDRNVPTQGARGFFEVEHVAAGGFHSLIVGMNGTLMGMGYNGTGQLGDGTFTQRVDPVEIAVDVTDASASEFHSMVIKSDGSLWVTGRNVHGQLGDGSTNNRNTLGEIYSGVTEIAAGDNHSLFITSAGELYGMGSNAFGQLGFERDASGDTDAVIPNSDPLLIGHEFDVVQVAAGGGHSLFIDSEGSLYGMGDNSVGQLGLGAGVNYAEEPVFIAGNVENVTSGRDHSLFVQNGDLYAMGSYARGKLGTGNTYNHMDPEFVDSGVSLIAAGLYHSVYVKNDGTLWGMGENARGQLGDGSGTDQHRPVLVDEGVIRIAAGIRHTLFVKD